MNNTTPKSKNKVMKKGAFDKYGDWWSEDEIKCFSGGLIQMCFGKKKRSIKIITKPLNHE